MSIRSYPTNSALLVNDWNDPQGSSTSSTSLPPTSSNSPQVGPQQSFGVQQTGQQQMFGQQQIGQQPIGQQQIGQQPIGTQQIGQVLGAVSAAQGVPVYDQQTGVDFINVSDKCYQGRIHFISCVA